MRVTRAPHEVPAAALAAALALAFALCRAEIVAAQTIAAALAGTAALIAGATLMLALVARLAAAPARDAALAGCGLAAAVLAVVLRVLDTPHPAAELAFDAALATAAAAAGRLFTNQVQEAWWVVPLGLTAGVADLVSVFVPGAPTQRMLATRAPLLDYLLLVWPVLDGRPARGFLGVSDLVIGAILYALTVRFGLDARRSFAALAAALWTCLALAGLSGVGLPAIPFMFLFYVLAHRAALLASFHARAR